MVLQQALADLNTAYRNFFNSVSGKRKGRKLAPPRFRSRKDNRYFASFVVTIDQDETQLCTGSGWCTRCQAGQHRHYLRRDCTSDRRRPSRPWTGRPPGRLATLCAAARPQALRPLRAPSGWSVVIAIRHRHARTVAEPQAPGDVRVSVLYRRRRPHVDGVRDGAGSAGFAG